MTSDEKTAATEVIAWIEKFEAGELEASDYGGSWHQLMLAVGSGAVLDPEAAADLVRYCANKIDRVRFPLPPADSWEEIFLAKWEKSDDDTLQGLIACGVMADDRAAHS